ncbi:MAG: response regulator [Clostridia bacterium]|nr:response regulator [Clostridia bacterium]
MEWAIYALIYIGSALMVHNIYGFIRFAHGMQKNGWVDKKGLLYIPVALLVMFLLGYLAVGIFGHPDLIVSGILFGGSIFVFVMYVFLRRITAKIIENERLKTQLIAAEQSNSAKAEFLSGISHEMRTPMNVIIGLDTMALMDGSLSAETRDRLEKIGLSAKHLLGLINNILDINSIDTGEFVVKNEEFRLGDAIGQINAIVGSLCAEKGLTYSYSCDDGLCGYYKGDEMRLKQILLCLLDNAVKYTDAPGTVELKAEDFGTEGAEAVRFTVKDTGIGIDPEFLPKIFDAFSREDASATSSHGGTGIGLALAKKIVGVLGGTVTAESEKNVGSTFTVVLPLVRVRDAETQPEQEKSLEGRRVLIVDDIPENAEIVADLLELEGVESEQAGNGRIALETFKASPPGYFDAILMDLRMPVMDGLTATREIRKCNRADAGTVPIIALTANAFESDVKQSFDAGMNAHLAKPADSDALYSTLRKLIK